MPKLHLLIDLEHMIGYYYHLENNVWDMCIHRVGQT